MPAASLRNRFLRAPDEITMTRRRPVRAGAPADQFSTVVGNPVDNFQPLGKLREA